MKNTLAYRDTKLITTVSSFVSQTLAYCGTKLLTTMSSTFVSQTL
jgi:hypothetical protein